MLAASDTPITPALRKFSMRGLDVCFLVPTETGMTKSIMDATEPVREYLKRHGIHDYDKQNQGTDHKVLVPAHIFNGADYKASQASLYRPQTKQGDPRIWFHGLKEHCRAGNLLAVISRGNDLLVVNCSARDLDSVLANSESKLSLMLAPMAHGLSSIANELLVKLKEIAARGFVPAVGHGDTTVGMTLEAALGIPPNSKKKPDYKGIELKAGRRGGSVTRSTLFAKVPDWDISKCKSSAEILRRFGYMRDDVLKLYCTVSAKKPNSQGLYFALKEEGAILGEFAKVERGIEDVANWRMEGLRQSLLAKHNETFWVRAVSRPDGASEQFKFVSATHTRRPYLSHLTNLLADGTVTMDHLIKELNGKVTEKGPLFKILESDFGLLFPPPVEHGLI